MVTVTGTQTTATAAEVEVAHVAVLEVRGMEVTKQLEPEPSKQAPDHTCLLCIRTSSFQTVLFLFIRIYLVPYSDRNTELLLSIKWKLTHGWVKCFIS